MHLSWCQKPGYNRAAYGGSGPGKELITKAIRDNSSRKNNRMMAVNCTVTIQTLIESE
jgi:transcriptional regulator with PAS, ATPase and Fis domain